MTSSTTLFDQTFRTEDLLSHLPVASTTEYAKGDTVYSPEIFPRNVYLVVTGKVGLSQTAENGTEILLEIIKPDELFGESAFLEDSTRCERAVAFETTTLMAWPVSEMEELLSKRPRLAVALLQVLALRAAEFSHRIGSFSIDSMERRLARSLLHFSERLGTPSDDGSVRMMPLTHSLLSTYVGTSREIVTHHMGRFRKRGYVSYSRRGINVQSDRIRSLLRGGAEQAAASESSSGKRAVS